MIEAKEKWGKTPQWQEFEQKTAGKTEDQMNDMGTALMDLFAELGSIKDQDPKGPEAQAKVKAIQDFITKNYYACTNDIFKSLSLMYVEDERFKSNIDKAGGEGTAAFAKAAIEELTK
ncbi:MAG: TipAS antibiotic-recognition domain-containing protein [Clostridia bacterium]|nr:TipAS antibiotic-recognition domain-containing protein [Clostridia bacterium]